MKRALRLAAGLAALAFVAAAVLAWRWTETPYGRMDLGAALVVHTMPSGSGEMTPEAREIANAWTAPFMGDPEPTVSIGDTHFPGPAGELPLRLYTPPGEGPFPVVAWIHGGGFWMGDDLPMWDGTCSRLAREANALVVSIGYRLAPEHPFPAAVEDSYAGLRFVAAHAREWHGDPTRLAVMGGSAGGNLAAVVAQRARDESGPPIVYQVLVVPALTAEEGATESRRIFARGYGLDGIPEMIAAYLPNPADRGRTWASPLAMERLRGLPPALILTAQFDPLRDEGEQYAARLQAAGVPATVQRMPGAIHGFLGSGDDRAASEALTAQMLRAAFAAHEKE